MLLREDVLAATRDYPEAQVNTLRFGYCGTGTLGFSVIIKMFALYFLIGNSLCVWKRATQPDT